MRRSNDNAGIPTHFRHEQRRVTAIVKDDLLELLAFVDQQKPMKAARDRALLLIGFAGAFRRSELVALRVEDVTPFDVASNGFCPARRLIRRVWGARSSFRMGAVADVPQRL
jgi:site-specific recombinase XerD